MNRHNAHARADRERPDWRQNSAESENRKSKSGKVAHGARGKPDHEDGFCTATGAADARESLDGALLAMAAAAAADDVAGCEFECTTSALVVDSVCSGCKSASPPVAGSSRVGGSSLATVSGALGAVLGPEAVTAVVVVVAASAVDGER